MANKVRAKKEGWSIGDTLSILGIAFLLFICGPLGWAIGIVVMVVGAPFILLALYLPYRPAGTEKDSNDPTTEPDTK